MLSKAFDSKQITLNFSSKLKKNLTVFEPKHLLNGRYDGTIDHFLLKILPPQKIVPFVNLVSNRILVRFFHCILFCANLLKYCHYA